MEKVCIIYDMYIIESSKIITFNTDAVCFVCCFFLLFFTHLCQIIVSNTLFLNVFKIP